MFSYVAINIMTHEQPRIQIGPDLEASFFAPDRPSPDELRVSLLRAGGPELCQIRWREVRPDMSGNELLLSHAVRASF